MIRVLLFSRNGCHLCEQAREDLNSLQEKYPHELMEIDIEKNEALHQAYFDKIPVVEIGPYRLTAPINKLDLQIRLAAAYDKERHHQKIDEKHHQAPLREKPLWTSADRASLWFSRHYMLVFNILVLLYVGLPVLAPVFMKIQWQTPAKAIYWMYGNTCHQFGYRSWYLFGPQAFYPMESAHLEGYTTFFEATQISEENTNAAQLSASAFIGNEQTGYKIALCQRDMAIYGAILLFGILFVVTGRKLPPLPLALWILVGMVPVGLDGLSQMLSQAPFSLYPLRESIPLFRTLTGALFGFTTAWFGYPVLAESMEESRKYMEVRLAKITSQAPRK